jgi:hypothetical protein
MTLARARGAELDGAGPEGAAALIWDDDPTVNGFEGLDMIRVEEFGLHTKLFTRKLRLARTWFQVA